MADILQKVLQGHSTTPHYFIYFYFILFRNAFPEQGSERLRPKDRTVFAITLKSEKHAENREECS